MPTSRSYGDACGIARALDAVGERWALLVVRELLLGPQRFTDLRRALPKASSNMLSDRLRELESRGVLRRRTMPPPAASVVYELTDLGRELEPIVLALGAWGLQLPLPPAPVGLSPTSVLLFLRGSLRPDPQAPPATYRVELDGTVWSIRTHGREVDVEAGAPADTDAVLRTDPATLNALISDPASLAAAVADGRAVVGGDEAALRRLLGSAAAAPAG
ncbi:winged helix-turn-helix transcriptional regulator [Petropleomorpha daqingensis]|uniref:DNA-binding HxlR family transcriptional regulator n=1 Tax=Petropleomorpha daqingensis TaxID=2026353 RepID=A0A853CF44_9ACTN|nr:winged helix-turn-helix transcriptional regulator [Petropleomorpha daqingensis]NYJ06504.1 DNA-binding HxlR family transcriptional regulator [Petropleomorpha daqingensis]